MTTAEEEGQRFLLLMEEEGHDQYSIAPIIEKPQSTVNKYIKGKIRIPAAVVKILNKKFRMSFDWFYGDGPNMKVKELPKKNLLTDIIELKLQNKLLAARLEGNIKITDKLIQEIEALKAKLDTHQ